jgi:hypothetical protein
MSQENSQDSTRTLSPSELLSWAEDNTRIMRLRTFRDVIPGGYMAAMAPALVEWRASDIEADEPHIIVRNLNYGGNPLEKTTTLHSVRVHLDAVEYAEFVLVPPPASVGGRAAPWLHAQIRFVFEEGREPELLNLADSETGTDARIPDLILSWESWRSPEKGFNVFAAMDEAAYGLSQRAYAGPQRFLEDSLHELEWFSYRLCIPGGRKGLKELLTVALALGDGVARHTFSSLLQQSEADWLSHAPASADDLGITQQWQTLQQRARFSMAPDDPTLNLDAGQSSYQTLVRSCSTLSRYTVLVTVHRLIRQGFTDGIVIEELPPASLRDAENWMDDVAHANLKGLFLGAPLALRYILRHPELLPVKIPDEFAKAGLVECDGHKALKTTYSQADNRPYGPDGINRIHAPG